MKKMGKNPQFVEKQQEKGRNGGMEEGEMELWTSDALSSIPPLSFLPYLPNSTLVIS